MNKRVLAVAGKAGEGDSTKMKAKELLGESRFKMLDAMIEDNG